ncbi:MAG TPA: hypothetical protein VMW65_02910 [Chloroflexota bacterium]|nr:hypothetical protein [Chloroflexota bacterium]
MPDPCLAVVKENGWILPLVYRRRVGDRITNALFVALAENEAAGQGIISPGKGGR